MTYISPGPGLEARQAQTLVGQSEHAQQMRVFASRAAPAKETVLLTGETGVGKDHLAEMIHALGRGRSSDNQFVHVNCAGIPENLLETELFGHTNGAFTDARREKEGLFEVAENGTIFLDEIGAMPPILQGKLLHVLEKRCFRKVGATRDQATNARIIAATNTNLKEAIQRNQFRSDLYYRVKVIDFALPPLRKRREDIALLAEHFLLLGSPGKKFTHAAVAAMEEYDWPGNVRELQHAVARAAFLTSDGKIAPEHIPSNPDEAESADFPSMKEVVSEAESTYVRKLLMKTGGNVAKATRIAGCSRDHMHAVIRRCQLTDFVTSLRG